MQNQINEAFVKISEEVKEIMIMVGYDVVDNELPELVRCTPDQWVGVATPIVYRSAENKIYFCHDILNPIPNQNFECALAHELVHSYQGIDPNSEYHNDPKEDAYWEQRIEIEAYVVQAIYYDLHMSGKLQAMGTRDAFGKMTKEEFKTLEAGIVSRMKSEFNSLISFG